MTDDIHDYEMLGQTPNSSMGRSNSSVFERKKKQGINVRSKDKFREEMNIVSMAA